MRVVEACAAWDRYLVPIYHVQARSCLLAKNLLGYHPRVACEREEPPQEEVEVGGAEGPGSGNGRRRWKMGPRHRSS